MVDIVKMIASSWKNLSDNQKKEFESLAEKDKIRYQKEQNELNEKGYFID
jgi:hypothetical protein